VVGTPCIQLKLVASFLKFFTKNRYLKKKKKTSMTLSLSTKSGSTQQNNADQNEVSATTNHITSNLALAEKCFQSISLIDSVFK
jgi:hypothetical protein